MKKRFETLLFIYKKILELFEKNQCQNIIMQISFYLYNNFITVT